MTSPCPVFPPPRPGRRPVLRPGFAAVRRSTDELQVGHGADHAVVPDVAAVRRLLDLLADTARPWSDPEDLVARRALRDLRAGGVVVPAPSTPLEERLAAQHGPDWAARAAARAGAQVSLAGAPALANDLAALLSREGVVVLEEPAAPSATGRAVQVLLADGPVRRDLLDGAETASLPVSLLPDGCEIGPLVVRGRTACLRCVDAARSQRDPRLPFVLDQAARSPRGVTASATTWQLAVALAVREVLAWVDGQVPATWSASLTVCATGAPARTEWLRHPECGCAWDVLLAEELG